MISEFHTTNDGKYLCNVHGLKSYRFILDNNRNKVAVEITISPIIGEKYLDRTIRLNKIPSLEDKYKNGNLIFKSI